jgi:hypothetical protein
MRATTGGGVLSDCSVETVEVARLMRRPAPIPPMTNSSSKIVRKGCLRAQKRRRRRRRLPEGAVCVGAVASVVGPRRESLIVFALHSVPPSRLRAAGAGSVLS